jgi:hypothetical protein
MRRVCKTARSFRAKARDQSFRCDHLVPADPIVLRICRELQAAWTAERRSPNKAVLVRQFERQGWQFLVDYLATLESPVEP